MKRYFGLDIVRILAICLLLWLHFFLRNGFYHSEATGFGGFLAVSMRPVFMCCIPLFLMLTGYLKCKKEWTIRYYLSLAPIIVSFFLISAIHLIYKLIRVDEVKSAGEWLWDFLNFHLADYSWYIGMYIGLFLISPLLNQLWNSLGTRKLHLMAVITMASVTFVPSTVNSLYVPEGMDGTILPTYFTGLWYVTYYLIGCYIRTYRPALKKRIGIPAALLVAAIQGLWNINSRTDPKNYYSG